MELEPQAAWDGAGITLEIEIDLELDDEQLLAFEAYRTRGMDEIRAWRQVAQDALGHTGAIVQGAEAVRS